MCQWCRKTRILKNDLSHLGHINWIFDQHIDSKEEFAKKFDEVMKQSVRKKWQEIEVNQSIDEKEIFLSLLGKVSVLNDTSSDVLADIEVR